MALLTYVNGDPVNLVDPTGHKACADEACYQFIIPQSGSHELRGSQALVDAENAAFQHDLNVSRAKDAAIRANDSTVPPAPSGTACGYSQDGKTGFVMAPAGYPTGTLCSMPVPHDACSAYSQLALDPHASCEGVLKACSGRPQDPNLDSQTPPCTDEVAGIRDLLSTGSQVLPGTDAALDKSMAQLQYILNVALKYGTDVPDRLHSVSASGNALSDWTANDLAGQGGGDIGHTLTPRGGSPTSSSTRSRGSSAGWRALCTSATKKHRRHIE